MKKLIIITGMILCFGQTMYGSTTGDLIIPEDLYVRTEKTKFIPTNKNFTESIRALLKNKKNLIKANIDVDNGTIEFYELPRKSKSEYELLEYDLLEGFLDKKPSEQQKILEIRIDGQKLERLYVITEDNQLVSLSERRLMIGETWDRHNRIERTMVPTIESGVLN